MRQTTIGDATVQPLNWRVAAVLVLVLWAIIEVGLIVVGAAPTLRLELSDSDAYLQLVKVTQLVETGNWYDSQLPRSNWPFGEVTTWTRSLDVVLLAGTALLRPFMNFHDALFWFGVAVSPLCALACAFGIGWMATPLLEPRARLGVMLLLLLQPGFLSYTYARGPNHHGIIFLAFIVACGFMLRALSQPQSWRAAVGAGAVTGLGLWTSIEFLLPLAVCLFALGLLWLVEGDRRVRVNRGFAIGLAVAIATLLPIERSPLTDLFTDEYDRLSIVHLALALILLGFWFFVPLASRYAGKGISGRAGISAIGAALGFLAMYAVYPKFMGGPMVDADPAILPFLIAANADWQSTLPTSLAGLGKFLVYAAPPALCLLWAARCLWIRRHDKTAPGWLFLSTMLLLYVAATFRSARFSAFAEIMSLIPLIDFVGWVRDRLTRHAVWLPDFTRAIAVTAIIVGLPAAGFCALALSSAERPAGAGDGCRLSDIAPLLNDPTGLGARRHVIVAEIHSGSELLYRTEHAVLATPMLRNPGILANYRILTAADDSTAKAIIDSRGVDLLLLCPGSAERPFYASGNHENTFYNRLIDGRLPGWIRPVPLADPLARDFRIFSVVPHAS